MADGDDMWGNVSALTGQPIAPPPPFRREDPPDPRTLDLATARKMTRRQLLEWQAVELATIRRVLLSNADTLESIRRDVNRSAYR